MFVHPRLQQQMIDGEIDGKRLAIFMAILIPTVIALIIFASIETKKIEARELNQSYQSESSSIHMDVGTREPKVEPKPEPIHFLYETRNTDGDLVIKLSDGEERFDLVISRENLNR